MANTQNKINQDYGNKNNNMHLVDLNDYNSLVEELRVRLNILSTSVFLLKDSYKGYNSPNQTRYFDKINDEMNKIKTLISSHPEEINFNQSANK
jgi:hypothetical protein